MNYELKHFNTTLLRFSATEDSATPEIEILWVNEKERYLLPLGMEISGAGIAKWLKQRTIPKNRAYVNNFLSKCGLHINRPMNIIKVSKGLSLNDCYWVVEEGFTGTFEKYNLYDNRFSQLLALIAFTGYGSSVRTSLASCPEFTTNGMLPKCWRRVDGTIRLYKGGTSGASNTGCEPYSEFYAAQVAKALGVDVISYNLSKWKGELCSVCDLFTSKDYSYLPVGRVITSGGMEAVEEYYQKLGGEYVNALHAMLVLDAVIFNTDRHFGNFGFMIDNKTNKIARGGFGVIAVLIVTQIIAKRMIVPFLSTPLAGVFKKQLDKREAKKKGLNPEETQTQNANKPQQNNAAAAQTQSVIPQSDSARETFKGFEQFLKK